MMHQGKLAFVAGVSRGVGRRLQDVGVASAKSLRYLRPLTVVCNFKK